MKEGLDKEIDSLLRRHVGGTVGSRSRADGDSSARVADEHPDADELSTFAEGSLPAAARVAAASHLADCDECRGTVVRLARAAGTEAEIEKRAAAVPLKSSEPVRRRSWLAALLAPGVLRYAAPALALCLVAAVTFVALRSRRTEDRLAQQAGKNAAPREGVAEDQKTTEADGSVQPSSDAAANANAPAASAATNGAAGHAANANEATANMSQGSKETAAGGSASNGTAQDRPDTLAAAPPAPTQKDAPAAAPAEPKPAQGETVEVTNAEDRAKTATNVEAGQVASEQPQQQQRTNLSRVEVQQQSPDSSRNQTRSNVNGAQGSNSAGAGGLVAGGRREERDRPGAATNAPAGRRARSSDDKRAKSEDEGAAVNEDEVERSSDTRSVAGHRFRRDGGAWVDVNYKPSMSSTGVRRGTDSYRALVADIPELGRVAEQLGGEVVVVIRGRAYRVR